MVLPGSFALAVIRGFVTAGPWKNQKFGVVLAGAVLVLVNMMLSVRRLANVKETVPGLFYLHFLSQGMLAIP